MEMLEKSTLARNVKSAGMTNETSATDPSLLLLLIQLSFPKDRLIPRIINVPPDAVYCCWNTNSATPRNSSTCSRDSSRRNLNVTTIFSHETSCDVETETINHRVSTTPAEFTSRIVDER